MALSTVAFPSAEPAEPPRRCSPGRPCATSPGPTASGLLAGVGGARCRVESGDAPGFQSAPVLSARWRTREGGGRSRRRAFEKHACARLFLQRASSASHPDPRGRAPAGAAPPLLVARRAWRSAGCVVGAEGRARPAPGLTGGPPAPRQPLATLGPAPPGHVGSRQRGQGMHVPMSQVKGLRAGRGPLVPVTENPGPGRESRARNVGTRGLPKEAGDGVRHPGLPVHFLHAVA
nr:POLG alternative reading frame-like [Dasypus novemcinctus]